MHIEHFKWQQKETKCVRVEKERDDNGARNELYLFVFDFLVECRLPFIPFHLIHIYGNYF